MLGGGRPSGECSRLDVAVAFERRGGGKAGRNRAADI
jgi:hypothetical protein